MTTMEWYSRQVARLEAAILSVESMEARVRSGAEVLAAWRNTNHTGEFIRDGASTAVLELVTWPAADEIGAAIKNYHHIRAQMLAVYYEFPETEREVIKHPDDIDTDLRRSGASAVPGWSPDILPSATSQAGASTAQGCE